MKTIKKYIAVILVLVMVLAIALSVVFAQETDKLDKAATGGKVELLLGDINGDGSVTATDARTILRIATRLEKTQDYLNAELVADANGDGNITAADARKVLRVATKLEAFENAIVVIEPTTETPTTAAPTNASTDDRALVAYFSCTGNTEKIANAIAQEQDCDTFEIEALVPYTEDDLRYYTDCRADREQNDDSARPEIKNTLSNMADYDVIFIGYPIWHGQAPRIISTFLESYDFSGKTIVPFCTSGSSPIGSSATNLHQLAENATWLEGKRFSSNASASEISEWVKALNISKPKSIKTPTIKLNSGYDMPVLGLGTWTLTGETCENAVYSAIKFGYRLIDTAQYYGNEREVGNAVKRAIDEGLVTREEVFITTKVMPTNYDNASSSIDESLNKLGMDYVDLFLVHQSGMGDDEVYKALCEGVKDGKIRSVGISNYYTADEFERVIKGADIKPAVVQNENHIYYQNTQFQEYVSKYGTFVESYYPFGGRGHTSESFNNEVIKEIAESYGKTSAQIILRWHIQAGYITIPGSSNPDHIFENISIFDFTLTSDQMQKIAGIDTGNRYESW